MWKQLRLAGLALCCIVLPILAAAAAPADAFRLGPDDKLRIRVYEWRNLYGQVQPEWSALNDEFTVGPSGDLLLPLVGSIPASGKTIKTLTDDIADRLQIILAMEQRPHISVEVARFRPFYILGAVNHPGEYPYRPGLTVLQALGIAGGLYRPLEGGLMQAQGPVTGAPGDLRILLLQYDRLLARRARLQAELDGAKEINFPADLADNESEPEVGGIIKQERAIFETRRDGLEAQLTSRGQVKDVLVNDLASLKQKIAMTDKEFALIKDELNKVSSLVSRGWATGPQQLQWQQNVLQIQRQQLDLQTAALHVQQEIAKANEGILALENDRHEQLLREMEDTSAKLSELGNKMGITEDPSEQPGSLPHVSSTPLDEAHAVFAITRAEETGTRELDATEATRVLPGDTIKVKRRAAEVPVAKNGTSSRDHAIRAAARTKAH